MVAAGVASEATAEEAQFLKRRTRRFQLLGVPIDLSEGDSTLNNTGWRTWGGSWLLAKYLEGRLASSSTPASGSEAQPTGGAFTHRPVLLDLSCGTGLAGVALAKAGHEVVLCDLEVNVPTIRANLRRNLTTHDAAGNEILPNTDANSGGRSLQEVSHATVVGYAWGQPLPPEMRRAFDIVVCGDLLYHVWSGRLLNEFLATLQDLYRRRGETGLEFLFGGQVRSTRQDEQVLSVVAQRLGLVQEELEPPSRGLTTSMGGRGGPVAMAAEEALLCERKYRLVRLYAPSVAPASTPLPSELPLRGTCQEDACS